MVKRHVRITTLILLAAGCPQSSTVGEDASVSFDAYSGDRVIEELQDASDLYANATEVLCDCDALMCSPTVALTRAEAACYLRIAREMGEEDDALAWFAGIAEHQSRAAECVQRNGCEAFFDCDASIPVEFQLPPESVRRAAEDCL